MSTVLDLKKYSGEKGISPPLLTQPPPQGARIYVPSAFPICLENISGFRLTSLENVIR